MTDAFNYILDGEYLWAILNPFIRIVGTEWTLFFLLMIMLVFLYLKTESLAMPLMVGITALASLNMSTLFSDKDYPLIPEQFDVWVALFLAGALAFLVYSIWMKK